MLYQILFDHIPYRSPYLREIKTEYLFLNSICFLILLSFLSVVRLNHNFLYNVNRVCLFSFFFFSVDS